MAYLIIYDWLINDSGHVQNIMYKYINIKYNA